MKLQVLVTYGAEGEGGAYNHTVAINQCHDERVLRLQRSVNSRDEREWTVAYESALILLQIPLVYRLLGLPCGFALKILLPL